MQRNPTFGASQEFLSSSPDRSFPLLVQFGHSSVPETREQSSDGGRQFRGVAVGCAAIPVVHALTNSIAWTAHFLAEVHDAQHKKVFDTVLVMAQC
jgi:hypothetical protein